MRVAVVLNKFDSGGIENMVVNYYRHMDRDAVQYDIYYNEKSTIPQYDELKAMGAGLYPIPSYSKLFRYIRTLKKAFREKKYRIVHAQVNTMSVFALFAAKKAGVPVRICHAHARGNKSEGLRYLLKILLRPFSTKYATDLFACGDESGRWMFKNRDFMVVPNAIDPKVFSYDDKARRELRQELSIPDDAFVVGHVGRFIVEKNHEFLLKIKEWLPEAYLLLIGEGDLESKITGDKVVKTGARKDVNKLYSAMDVFCLPSISEGLPVVVVEAQANGLECVVSKAVPEEANLGGLCYRSLEESAEKWAESIRNGKRFSTEVPAKWNIESAAKILENWYVARNGDTDK